MSSAWYVIRRVAWSVLVLWLVLSLTFGFVALTPDPNEALVAFSTAASGSDSHAATEAYRAATNRDEPLVGRYARWLTGFARFDWGTSRSMGGEPVTNLIAERLPITLLYVLPAMAFAVGVGIGIGLYSATNRGSWLALVARILGYFGVSVPNFWLAQMMIIYLGGELGWFRIQYVLNAGPLSPQNLRFLLLPTVVVGTNLLAAQIRHTRAEAADYVATEAIKLVRAKGATSWTVYRHVLRNAAIPLVSLFFTELLGTLFITVYVIEVVFGIPGIGLLSYNAIFQRDMALVLGTAMVPVFLGVFGNLLQDVAYSTLDPRVELGE